MPIYTHFVSVGDSDP